MTKKKNKNKIATTLPIQTPSEMVAVAPSSSTPSAAPIPLPVPPIPAGPSSNEGAAAPRQVVTFQMLPMQTVLHTFQTQQPPTFNSTISHTHPIAVIDKSQYDEWKKMVDENIRLKERISLLEGEYTEKLREKDIEIKQLQDTVHLNSEEMKALKEENESLKSRLAGLESHISIMEKRISDMDLRHLAERYIYAIQDLNSLVELEKKIPAPHNEKLRKLRRGRNAPVHFIYDDDEDEVVQTKVKYTILKLRSIPEPVRDHIEKRYGTGIIKGIHNYMMTKFSEHEVLEVSVDSDDAAWWEAY